MEERNEKCNLCYPDIVSEFLVSPGNQRDFREFLFPVGRPDLLPYVDFLIETYHSDHKKSCENLVRVFQVFERYIHPKSPTKLTRLHLSTKTNIRNKLMGKENKFAIYNLSLILI